jgi:hypothetical protein
VRTPRTAVRIGESCGGEDRISDGSGFVEIDDVATDALMERERTAKFGRSMIFCGKRREEMEESLREYGSHLQVELSRYDIRTKGDDESDPRRPRGGVHIIVKKGLSHAAQAF